MKHRSLKHRIARSFVLLALLVSSFFTLVTYVSVEVIEVQLIDTRLEKLSSKLISQFQLHQVPETPTDLDFYVNAAIPQSLRHLKPGIHDVVTDQRELRVFVRNDGSDRFMLVDEISDFERTELIIFASLGAGFVASLLLAMLLGWTTAKHIVAPVSELADAVANKDTQAILPALDAQDEIGVLARAFAHRTDELQQFLMRERLFSGDVSHELRTPLTIMLGAAEVLKVQLTGRPEQLAVAERVRRVAAETSDRVSALLMLSRSPETLDAPRIALNPLIELELERCLPLMRGKAVQCKVDCNDTVWVNARPELAGIVIGNLLRNACQYTDAGTINVQLRATNLSIEDHGPGLPPAVLARLFERFVHGPDAAQTGTGLGLSIVKRVVDHLGWEIRFESPTSGGSRFVVIFPSLPATR
jgi:signal transduction histidine kinase